MGSVAGLTLLACVGASSSVTTSPAVRVDGRVDEWAAVEPVVTDPSGDVPAHASVDLGSLRLADDSRWLYALVDTGRPVNAQSFRGTVRLVLDTDADSRTGDTQDGLDGADLVIVLSRQDQPRPEGYGAGIGVRVVGAPGDSITSGYPAGLIAAPTHSGSDIELRVDRGYRRGDGSPFFGAAVRARLVFEGPGDLRDETDVGTHRFATEMTPISAPAAVPDKGDAWRVVQWNVGGTQLVRHAPVFAAVLGGLAPDILILDEVHSTTDEIALTEFFAQPAMRGLGEWTWVRGASGGRQHGVVATIGRIRPEPALAGFVGYPEGILASLAATFDDARLARAVTIEDTAGVAVAGAWVTLDARELLVTALDLQSTGYHGSWEDRLRVIQARVIHQRLLAALDDRPAPMVVGGDFNLVGSAEPLAILRAVLDDGAALSVAESYDLTGQNQATWWDGALGPFTPGRLDFVLYSGSALVARRAFIFESALLSEEHRAAWAISAEASRRTSNHRPVVVDFVWRETR